MSTDCFLKLCCDARTPIQAKEIHCRVIRNLRTPETILLNNLVSTYSRLNNLIYARRLFDKIPHPNLFSWNTILSAYSKSGLFSQMQETLKLMPERDGVSWNCVISGYANQGLVVESVKAYSSLLRDGARHLNRITFSTMLILSSKLGRVTLGKQIHGHILKFGFLKYVFVGSPLIDMYSKATLVHDARQVFEEMPERNVVMYNTMITGLFRSGLVEDCKQLFRAMEKRDSISWTTMISGLCQNGFDMEAVGFFQRMRSEGLEMDQFTYGSVLTACGRLMASSEGMPIHAHAMKTGYDDHIVVGSALVDMYCKCKNIIYAERVFNAMTCKNDISWTAMLVGYGQNGFSEDAIMIFRDMRRDRIEPDEYTLGSVISSCANLASLEEGAQFHCRALVSGYISFVTVSNALISLYGKCGSIDSSHRIFNEMSFRDEVSWTALFSAYSQFGKAKQTLDLFHQMLALGLKPDGVTFIGVLTACSRAGLVSEGHQYFESMVNDHGITPSHDHYTCMIDLLSRSGRLDEAKSFINNMPFPPDAIGWVTLLSSCRLKSNIEIGKWAADSLMQIDPDLPASYVLLSSIYASKGKWDEVSRLKKRMKDRGARKEPGFSWIRYKNQVHVFSADDLPRHHSYQIYDELERLTKRILDAGYIPDTGSILHDVDDAEKLKMLYHHSERLAIAFGLMFIPSGLPIRVNKNLRVCGDCHNATKYISKVTRREILVRDSVRFHLFKDGSCSCGDFW